MNFFIYLLNRKFCIRRSFNFWTKAWWLLSLVWWRRNCSLLIYSDFVLLPLLLFWCVYMHIGPHVISHVGFSYSTKCAFLVFKLIALLGKYRFWFDFPFCLVYNLHLGEFYLASKSFWLKQLGEINSFEYFKDTFA